jgi:hypothetical protein
VPRITQVELPDLEAAARNYARFSRNSPTLRRSSTGFTSAPGPDGHNASLVPGDPAPDVAEAEVALTGFNPARVG